LAKPLLQAPPEAEETPTPTAAAPLDYPQQNLSVVAAPNLSRDGEPIQFQISMGGPARMDLALFTLLGERVYQVSAEGHSGRNSLAWNLQNNAGSSVASGLYIYILRTDNGVDRSTKMGKVAVLR